MASYVKSKLKAAKEAIGKKDWETARDASEGVLNYEASNYHANVFLGLALLNLEQFQASEKAYRRAIESAPMQPLAWQGLASFYERRENWDRYVQVLEELMELFNDANDPTRLAETLQKLLAHRRLRSTPLELADALALLLPSSRYYPVLSQLPEPEPTAPLKTTTFATQEAVHDALPVLLELVGIHEKEEGEWRRREVEKRRTRLNAPTRDALQREVGLEAAEKSKLPPLYNEVLNHPSTSDDLRRSTESALLRFHHAHLLSLPAPPSPSEIALIKKKPAPADVEAQQARKDALRAEVQEMVRGMVLLNIPDELAWIVAVEWEDREKLDNYDPDLLRRFRRLFPQHGLSTLISGYLSYFAVEFEPYEDEPPSVPYDEALDLIITGFEASPDSLFAHRVLSEAYLWEEDWENASGVAEAGLELVRRLEKDIGRPLPETTVTLQTTFAVSLTHLHPPQHHPRALGLLSSVLSSRPASVPALMARGVVLQHAGKWADARGVFARVRELDAGDAGLEAWEEESWCAVMEGRGEEGREGLEGVLEVLEQTEGRELQKARAWWRLGKTFWEMGDDRRQTSYSHFITSIKRVPTYAPSFTALGLFYLHASDPPDHARASKCFQKAFELDPRENEAAQWLADGFADEREWDLVEIVARRTVEGEGGTPEELVKGRYLSRNAWAWKAIGVVELSRQNYPGAIQAFQIALRAEPKDVSSWLRLGEAYAAAGRHAAALKTFSRAHELHPDNWLASYATADVQRQLGLYQPAIDLLEDVLGRRPGELGVLAVLAQTHLALGRTEFATGFTARCGVSLRAVLERAEQVVRSERHLRMVWKTVGDAATELAKLPGFEDPEKLHAALAPLLAVLQEEQLEEKASYPGTFSLSSLLSTPPTELQPPALRDVAVAAYQYCILLDFGEPESVSTSWYDLALALHARGDEKNRKYALGTVRQALAFEPFNENFWNALGNLSFERDVKLAQHSYIKAIECDPRNALFWTNLGCLYLAQHDLELSNAAFLRAQTLDPDYVLAWVGQALVASASGDVVDSRVLFEHAFTISYGAELESDFNYASRVFALFSPDSAQQPASGGLHAPSYALQRFTEMRPDDPAGLHLHALVCERLGQLDLAAEQIDKAIALLVSAYEESESAELETQFAMANASLGRIRLALKDYAAAADAFSSAASLTPAGASDPRSQLLRCQAQFGLGVVRFFQDDREGSLEALQAALEDLPAERKEARGHVAVLLAQTLWSMGGEELRDAAKGQLLDFISTDADNLGAITALAAIGTLTDDDGLVDAALAEILAMPIDKRLALDPARDVDRLLVQHHLSAGNLPKARFTLSRALHAQPASARASQDLASSLFRDNERDLARRVALGRTDPRDPASLRLAAFAKAQGSTAGDERQEPVVVDRQEYVRDVGLREAQRAVMLAPWDADNWRVLAAVRLAEAAA